MAVVIPEISNETRDAAVALVDLCEQVAVAEVDPTLGRNHVAAATAGFAVESVIDEIFTRLHGEDRGDGFAEVMLGIACAIAARSHVLHKVQRAMLGAMIIQKMAATWEAMDGMETTDEPS